MRCSNEDTRTIEARLAQEEELDSFLNGAYSPWTTVYEEWRECDGSQGGSFATFAEAGYRTRFFQDASWDLTPYRCGQPAIEENGSERKYIRFNAAEGLIPLLYFQHFDSIVEPQILISEEFVMLLGLWRDDCSGIYRQIQENGTFTDAIRIGKRKIEIRTSLLRRYQENRGFDLLLFTESINMCPGETDITKYGGLRFSLKRLNEQTVGQRDIGCIPPNCEAIQSRLLVKQFIPAPRLRPEGPLPWEEKEEYPEYIIAEDEYGEPVYFTCDPEKLANEFGKNRMNPYYLTPVFFDREVLKRYYDDPGKYEVRESNIQCGARWGITVDNLSVGHVMVWLGDLGRDLPSAERMHWKAFNIPPIVEPSKTYIQRQILGLWVESNNPEFSFKRAYEQVNLSILLRGEIPIYRELKGTETQILRRLRIPVNQTQTELESQLLNLTKLLIDQLNVKEMKKVIGSEKDERSLGTFKRFLEATEYPFVERDIAFLHRLQRLRSQLSAHTTGDSGQKLLKIECGGRNNVDFFVDLLNEANQMLDAVQGCSLVE